VKFLDRWNNADTTLLCAALCFLAAVGIKITFPASVVAEGFLFVTEAALVGGIADWFAVTALFKKPLGFPFHTAILPRRRKDFVKASVVMVQQEFFSRRTIFKKLGDFKLMPRIVDYLAREETRKLVVIELFNVVKKYVAAQNKETRSKSIANELRRILRDIPAQGLINDFGSHFKRNNKDREIFISIVKAMRKTAAKPETCDKLQAILEEYANEKTKNMGGFSILMAGLAQMLDLVNFEEAARIMQVQLLKLLDELAADSQLHRRTLNECRLKISELSETPEFKDLVERIQIDAANALPLEEAIELALIHLEKQISTVDLDEALAKAQSSKKFPAKSIGVLLVNTFNEEYDKFLRLLHEDTKSRSAFEKFIDELTARAALHAQPLVGTVAKSALDRLTEEQLNNLVYDKAEQDFIWIRLNGSIVGSVVGLAIFVLIKAAGLSV
ncbi:MAG: DUF445 domain-containing protein, partial [Selenomonadaceae bacterium]|nr:DUF445 domain-containing protein [Selenomonadaceae bacterium]